MYVCITRLLNITLLSLLEYVEDFKHCWDTYYWNTFIHCWTTQTYLHCMYVCMFDVWWGETYDCPRISSTRYVPAVPCGHTAALSVLSKCTVKLYSGHHSQVTLLLAYRLTIY